MSVTVFGVTVRVNFFFVAILAFLMLVGNSAVVSAAVLCALLHVAAHIAAMFMTGSRPKSIVFLPVGVRITRRTERIEGFLKEGLIFFAGPFFNLLLGVLLSLFYNLMQAANSLEHFAALDKGYPGEPLIMDGELFGLDELGMWQGLKTAFQIK